MKKGQTIASDLKSAGKALDEFAKQGKDSFTCGGQWTNARDKAEYDELKRLAKRMRSIARAFWKN